MITLEPHIQALIFDCDGTLADTMPLHHLAWQETLQAAGKRLPEQIIYELAGASSDKIAMVINERYGYKLDPHQTAAEKEQRFLKHITKARPIAPVVDVARRHKGRLPVAVASGGIRPVVQSVLAAIGLADFFEAVVTAEDVAHPKPAPDVFLEAARQLKVAPQYCHVFEDGDLGLEAARRAGMSATDIRLVARNK
jgi:beta-phosphoglucomutase family hydrolase